MPAQGPCPVWIPSSQSIKQTNLALLMAAFQVGLLCTPAPLQAFALGSLQGNAVNDTIEDQLVD